CRQFGDVTQKWQLSGQIDQTGSSRGQRRPYINVRERVGTARTQASLVVVGEKLGLVSGDVHSDRTIALTPLARQAKIQRVLNVLVAPSVADHIALGHLP